MRLTKVPSKLQAHTLIPRKAAVPPSRPSSASSILLRAAPRPYEDGPASDSSSGEENLDAMDTLELFERLEGTGDRNAPPDSEENLDYFGESNFGNFHELPAGFVERISIEGALSVLGLEHARDLLDMEFDSLRSSCYHMLSEMGVSQQYPGATPNRGVFCNRTLNFRSLRALGFDMDYTLLHYNVLAWEGKAYEVGLDYLRAQGLPVEGLKFNSDLVIRGLIVDKENGNLVKADRFGYIKRAMHGTRMLSVSEIREQYGRSLVDLKNEGRWTFLNTFFSVSEACLYAQMVDRLDLGMLSLDASNQSYHGLFRVVNKALFRAHVEGKIKSEIIKNPERFVELDPELPLALLDMKQSGKQLLLITNSDYEYTERMMSFAFNRYLPDGLKWNDLFAAIVVQAKKPEFFSQDNTLYEIVTADGLMRPAQEIRPGALLSGGSAKQIEAALGVSAEDIMFCGDHIYSDVALSKMNLRWRTCLILRELELEIDALAQGREHRRAVKTLINKKEAIGDVFNQLRLWKMREGQGRTGLVPRSVRGMEDETRYNETMSQLLMLMEELDNKIGPGIDLDGSFFNTRWGFLSRAGLNDKSFLTNQIEKYADILTSRVSNFLRYTPFAYYRSPSQPLVHDRSGSVASRRQGAAAGQNRGGAGGASSGAGGVAAGRDRGAATNGHGASSSSSPGSQGAARGPGAAVKGSASSNGAAQAQAQGAAKGEPLEASAATAANSKGGVHDRLPDYEH